VTGALLSVSATDVPVIVVGVLLSLVGLGLLLMGVIAMASRRWKRGAIGTAVGAVALVVGFLLVGVLG
jgi:hypothetical protein